MNTRQWLACAILGCLLLVVPAAGAAEKWLHVRVVEDGGDGETVNVNIPLSLVERMLPLISVDELQAGKLRLDALDEELGQIDLRELAAALRDAPDADYLTIQGKDEKLRVAKEGEFLVINADERGRGSAETVRVRIPLAVVDAMVGSDPNELDLVAALQVLSEYDDAPLVDVQSDDSSVQVWIDSSETGR
jgi:hypothetical protein